MPDREKVIKGLECCILGNKHEPDCDVCPYSAGCNDTCDTMDEIHGDALALLKAQELVEPTIGGDADGPCRTWWYQCGKCKEAIDYHDKYCRNCGQAVKWETLPELRGEAGRRTEGQRMRLTDADKQLEWVDCMTPIHGIGLEPVVAVETVRDLIKGTPTIDAIPVEWLRDKMRGYASSLKSTETAALVMVMQMWQKEQEAR